MVVSPIESPPLAGVAQLVEHLVAIQKVTSSNLVSRSIVLASGATMYSEIQALIDANQFVNGKANSTSIIEGEKRLLFLSPSGIQHVLSRHRDRYAPGSLFNQNVDFDSLISSFIDTDPDEVGGNGFVKWLGKDVGTIVGSMGVKKGTVEEVAKMRDYQMPDSRTPEKVKVAAGERTPTSEISLIIAPMGKLSDGREVFSLVTMFPGGTVVDGQELPMNRNEFADLGFYFVLPEDSPML